MFEFHNLGALAVGAVLIGGMQLGGVTGMDSVFEGSRNGAKFVSASAGRRDFDPRMQATGKLADFASEQKDAPDLIDRTLIAFDTLRERAGAVGHDMIEALKR